MQDKIYQEIIEILGDGNAQPAYSDLMQMRYLEMCIKESMRLYPSVPIIGRVASKDVHMPSGYTIPKGANIHVHIYDLHRNSDVYPDPEKFDPERFLPENTSTRHPFSYLPFSGGPRNCIGKLLQIKFSIYHSNIIYCFRTKVCYARIKSRCFCNRKKIHFGTCRYTWEHNAIATNVIEIQKWN